MEEQQVTNVQRIMKQELTGFKCSGKLHWKSYYWGLLSYAKPILSAEQEETYIYIKGNSDDSDGAEYVQKA